MTNTLRSLKQSDRKRRMDRAGVTIRELCLVALPATSGGGIEPDSTLEHGGRKYRVSRRQFTGEVEYVYVCSADRRQE